MTEEKSESEIVPAPVPSSETAKGLVEKRTRGLPIPPETWRLIKIGYVAGDSARELARRYGVSHMTILNRANIDDWKLDRRRFEDEVLAEVKGQLRRKMAGELAEQVSRHLGISKLMQTFGTRNLEKHYKRWQKLVDAGPKGVEQVLKEISPRESAAIAEAGVKLERIITGDTFGEGESRTEEGKPNTMSNVLENIMSIIAREGKPAVGAIIRSLEARKIVDVSGGGDSEDGASGDTT